MRSVGLRDSTGVWRGEGFAGVVKRPYLATETLATLDCFLAVGLLGLYLKVAMMGDHWGAVARFLGKRGAQDLTFAERAGFFANDVVLNLLILPLAGTILFGLLFRAYRVAASVAIGLAVSGWYFVELRTQDALGQYLSRDVLADLAGWAMSNPTAARDYATAASVFKFGMLIGALLVIPAIAAWARRAERRGHTRLAARYRQLLAMPAAALPVAAILIAPVCYTYQPSGSLLTASSVGRAAAMLTTRTDDRTTVAGHQTLEQLLAASSTLTQTPSLDRASPLVGKEQGSDVIIFILETGAARALDLASMGRQLPGAGALYDRAFVAERHYTSHPYSSDAVYSMISGMYPQGRRPLVRRAAPGSLNGLMSALPDYPVRRVYVPSLYQLELDDRMYAAFGAERVYASDQHPGDLERAAAMRRADEFVAARAASGPLSDRHRHLLRSRLVADFQAMESMKADIAEAVRADRRYAVIFFPGIAHAPWIPLTPGASVIERGRDLMRLQDGWLKEIVDHVRRAGRLNRTIIAFTGDHGVRTQAEDPDLVPSTISDYMFRVPLVIHAPQTLSRTLVLSNPTSHIDIAPTLLALLGRTGPASRMQGVPLWQRSSGNRIYFLAFAYGGADGFLQDGTYYMRQSLSGAVARSPDFVFDEGDRVGPADRLVPFVNGALSDLDALQRMLVAHQFERPRQR